MIIVKMTYDEWSLIVDALRVYDDTHPDFDPNLQPDKEFNSDIMGILEDRILPRLR
jgi:hypothetical protein